MQSMKRSRGHESSQEGEDGEEEGDDVELTQAIKRQRLEIVRHCLKAM